MKSYCIKDINTKNVFKILLSLEEFEDFLKKNPNMVECIECVECDDAPSITFE